MADKYFVNVAVGADTDAECPKKFSGKTIAVEDVAAVLALGDLATQDEVANVAAEATADGSDSATTQALANALKVKVNAILTALKAAGVMAADA